MASSNFSNIRDEVFAVLDGVATNGKCYKYARLQSDWAAFLDLFRDAVDTTLISGWTMSRTTSPEKHLTNGEHQREITFRLRGYYGVVDLTATELAFDQIVEDVCDAFRGELTFNGTAERSNPPQVRVVEYRAFGPILCHCAEIELTVFEVLDRN